MKKQLHPAVKVSWRISSYLSVILLVPFFSIWFFPIASFFSVGFFGFLKIFVIVFVIVAIFAEIWVRLAYNRWFYEFTPTNLKVERGVIFKRYSNVPYGRVQNVDIRRGIIARMFDFSSVFIQTAGYSNGGKGGMGSEGYLPAVNVEEAEKIRDFLMKKISKRSSQGL